MSQEYRHEPVMVAEVLAALESVPDGVILDATLGGAGHAEAILEAFPAQRVIGIDRDPAAVSAAGERLARFGPRAIVRHARFDLIASLGGELDNKVGVSAVLFDLGVSSHQLDSASRGFSYQNAGPLDMRMDQSNGEPASALIERADLQSLTQLFYSQGEERFAARIARAVLEHRPFSSTAELAEVVAAAVPQAARRRGHPARRVFQALRIAVNDELGLLGPAIDGAIAMLRPQGRVVVLSYHSGEDRIVKERFRFAETGGCVCPPGLPCVCGAVPTVRVLTRGARLASKAEIAANPRAESARLRIAERLDAQSPSAGASR